MNRMRSGISLIRTLISSTLYQKPPFSLKLKDARSSQGLIQDREFIASSHKQEMGSGLGTRNLFLKVTLKSLDVGNTILSDTDISLKMLESKPMTPPSNMIRNIRTVYQNLAKKSDTKT